MTLNFWCHHCARTLHQILHLDLDIQYSLKITKSQELVKFNMMFKINLKSSFLISYTKACQILIIGLIWFRGNKTPCKHGQ